MIKEFETRNNVYVHSWPHRRDICDLPCVSERGVKVKIHKNKSHKPEPPQDFNGRFVEKPVLVEKLKAQQMTRPVIRCGQTPLDNVLPI